MSCIECMDSYVAGDIMTSSLVTVKPSDSIRVAAKRMNEKNVGSVLVVDNNGNLVGILTERDLVRIVAEDVDPDTPVEKVMTRKLVTAEPGESLVSILCKMLRHNIRHVPVVVDRKPVGIVSIRDLVRVEAAEQQLCATG